MIEYSGGEVAQRQTALANVFIFGFEHWTVFVERRECCGKFVDVGTQTMRAVFVNGVDDCSVESKKFDGQFTFLWLNQIRCDVANRFALNVGSTEDAANTRVRILQIRPGVAVEKARDLDARSAGNVYSAPATPPGVCPPTHTSQNPLTP